MLTRLIFLGLFGIGSNLLSGTAIGGSSIALLSFLGVVLGVLLSLSLSTSISMSLSGSESFFFSIFICKTIIIKYLRLLCGFVKFDKSISNVFVDLKKVLPLAPLQKLAKLVQSPKLSASWGSSHCPLTS